MEVVLICNSRNRSIWRRRIAVPLSPHIPQATPPTRRPLETAAAPSLCSSAIPPHYLIEPLYSPKERIKNVQIVNLEIILHFNLKYRIYILPQIGCVCNAARI